MSQLGGLIPNRSEDAERAVYRRAGRDLAIGLLALAVLGGIVGWLIAGLPGLLGAALGIALAALVTMPTPWTGGFSSQLAPTTSVAVVMGVWLAKLLALVGALALLRNQTWYHRGMLFAMVLLGAILGTATLARALMKGRVPYIDAGDPKS